MKIRLVYKQAKGGENMNPKQFLQVGRGVLVLVVVAILVGLYRLLAGTSLLGASLENPADTVLHLAVGAWALYAVFGAGKTAAKSQETPSQDINQ